MKRILDLTLAAAVTLGLAAPALASPQRPERGAGCGHGCGHRGAGHHGGGGCGGAAASPARPSGDLASPRSDMQLFHWLIDRRESIRRSVETIPEGVVTLTESDDPEVAAGIREHVAAMHARLLEGRPIHRRDPLFAEIFDNREAITMQIEETEHGLRVVERSDDPWVAKLIQAHAEVVSGFLENGRAEMHRDHAIPPRP
jgi:hypothetical protein